MVNRQQELFTEINAKRLGDGLEPMTAFEFVLELSYMECEWLERHPEAV